MADWKQFAQDESGAVTVDWVVLTAGVVAMAMLVMPPIKSAIGDMAGYIRDTVLAYGDYLQP
ncbi:MULTISPECIES: hypothetical protein [Tabrizicola]|uniref:hypothetical protein n=1 Tax=Tabrizicola TaxID=1443919 RepID=UPI00108071F6|nr:MULTISPECIES: hypothetical protein [Paracoccaceae]